MAAELQMSFSAGKNCYFLIRNRVGQIWNTSGGTGAFETYASSVYSSYAISATEQGASSAYYQGTFPPAIVPGLYNILGRQQITGSVAESDPTVAAGTEQWNGSVLLPLSDLSTSGQIGQMAPQRLARGTMVQNFQFGLVSSVDHVSPFTSGTVSGQIVRDNGSFGALQSGAFTEVGLGVYRVQAITSGDLLANVATVIFTANGISGGSADPRSFTFILQRTSGF